MLRGEMAGSVGGIGNWRSAASSPSARARRSSLNRGTLLGRRTLVVLLARLVTDSHETCICSPQGRTYSQPGLLPVIFWGKISVGRSVGAPRPPTEPPTEQIHAKGQYIHTYILIYTYIYREGRRVGWSVKPLNVNQSRNVHTYIGAGVRSFAYINKDHAIL